MSAPATPTTFGAWRGSSPAAPWALVLAGGGARGFAHIGIIKALKEAGVPFDHVGGTSMGAIIAAGLAQEWDVPELTERMREVFVTDNPLNDFTLPLIALVRGQEGQRHAAEAFRRYPHRGIAHALLLRLLRSHHRAHP